MSSFFIMAAGWLAAPLDWWCLVSVVRIGVSYTQIIESSQWEFIGNPRENLECGSAQPSLFSLLSFCFLLSFLPEGVDLGS